MNDEPKGDRERWAEQEAEACDRMVDSYAENLLARVDQLRAKLTTNRVTKAYAYLATGDIHSIATQMNSYHMIAENLRRPRRIRIEREAYDR